MKGCLSFCLLLAFALPCGASSTRPLAPLPAAAGIQKIIPPADPDHFVFALTGDNRSAGRNIPPPPTAGQIFAEMRLLQPTFTLWTGDTIYGSDDTLEEAEAEYNAFLIQATQANLPVYNAPGNHEIFDRKEMEALYQRKMGRLYGSFDYGNSHFIALDTEEVGEKSGIGKAQKEWLQSDLEANRKAAHIFVFMHHPLFPKNPAAGWADTANRDAVHKLFVQYGVKYVFAGHEHLYYKSVQDGITYYVSGGGGAPTDAAPEEGGFQHYVLFEVNGAEVKATVLQPWRAFISPINVTPDGASHAIVTNYNNSDLPFYAEFPENKFTSKAVPSASWTYKGQTQPLEAKIVPSRRPGIVTVRVVAPKFRAVSITLQPKTI